MVWQWIERKLFRRLELRLSAELERRLAFLQSHVMSQGKEQRELGRALLSHAVDLIDDTERLLECSARDHAQSTEILAFAKMAADVRQATVAADHAAKLEQLSRNVSQAIALQWGKTTDPINGPVLSRAPRDFDGDRRQ
jgi:hypothetical protein